MTIPVSLRSASPPSVTPEAEPTAHLDATRGPRFADVLRGPEPADHSPVVDAIRNAAHDIARGERTVNGVIDAARRGKTFSNEELLAVQAGVYRYTQELELASKLVDKVTGAVKQTLQSQQ